MDEIWASGSNEDLAGTSDEGKRPPNEHEDALGAPRPGNFRRIDASAWRDKAQELSNLARHEEALQALTKATDLDPADPLFWRERGVVLWNLGRHEEALQALTKATDLDPADPLFWRERGVVLWNLGRHEEALQAYTKATEVDPAGALAWRFKGMALGNLARHEEALQAYTKATEVDPAGALAWRFKGMALGSLARHEEALQAYTKATELDPIAGRVARLITQDELVINRGREHGMDNGMVCVVLDPRTEHVTDPESGEDLGSLRRVKVRLIVVDTGDRVSLARADRAISPSGLPGYSGAPLQQATPQSAAASGGDERGEPSWPEGVVVSDPVETTPIG